MLFSIVLLLSQSVPFHPIDCTTDADCYEKSLSFPSWYIEGLEGVNYLQRSMSGNVIAYNVPRETLTKGNKKMVKYIIVFNAGMENEFIHGIKYNTPKKALADVDNAVHTCPVIVNSFDIAKEIDGELTFEF